MLGPNGGKGSETTGGLDVTNNTDNDNWRGFDDGDSLDNLTLVHLGSRSVEVTNNVGHTGLETHGSGQVDGLLGVVLGEGLDLTPVSGSTLPGKVGQRTGSWFLVLSVRHVDEEVFLKDEERRVGDEQRFYAHRQARFRVQPGTELSGGNYRKVSLTHAAVFVAMTGLALNTDAADYYRRFERYVLQPLQNQSTTLVDPVQTIHPIRPRKYRNIDALCHAICSHSNAGIWTRPFSQGIQRTKRIAVTPIYVSISTRYT